MADNILTRNIGPLPGWAWGGAAVLGGLLFFAARKSKAGAPGAAGQPGAPGLSPAASAIPFVPSVYVTGQQPGTGPGSPPPPPSPPPPGTTPPPGTGQLLVQGGAAYGGGTYLRSQPSYPFGASILVPAGTKLTQTGPPVVGTDPNLGQNPMIPVSYLGGSYYVSSQDVVPVSGTGGAGGWGQAGASSPSGFMGWTWLAGWTPVGSGVSLGQRTGSATGLTGGAGAGASSSINRTGVARKSKVLRRRALTRP